MLPPPPPPTASVGKLTQASRASIHPALKRIHVQPVALKCHHHHQPVALKCLSTILMFVPRHAWCDLLLADQLELSTAVELFCSLELLQCHKTKCRHDLVCYLRASVLRCTGLRRRQSKSFNRSFCCLWLQFDGNGASLRNWAPHASSVRHGRQNVMFNASARARGRRYRLSLL